MALIFVLPEKIFFKKLKIFVTAALFSVELFELFYFEDPYEKPCKLDDAQEYKTKRKRSHKNVYAKLRSIATAL